MDIINIGRGGNQKPVIKDKSVPLYQGFFAKDKDGDMIFSLRNVKPIYFNGERVCSWSFLVESGSKVTMGNNITFTLEELLEPMDIDELKDWGLAMTRFDSLEAAEVFSLTSLYEYVDEDNNVDTIAHSSTIGCLAYYQIERGKFREAQENIYEAADDLYTKQDGSEKYKRAYTAILGLAAYFYFKIGEKELAKSTLEDFSSIISSGVKCSEEVMEVVRRVTL